MQHATGELENTAGLANRQARPRARAHRGAPARGRPDEIEEQWLKRPLTTSSRRSRPPPRRARRPRRPPRRPRPRKTQTRREKLEARREARRPAPRGEVTPEQREAERQERRAARAKQRRAYRAKLKERRAAAADRAARVRARPRAGARPRPAEGPPGHRRRPPRATRRSPCGSTWSGGTAATRRSCAPRSKLHAHDERNDGQRGRHRPRRRVPSDEPHQALAPGRRCWSVRSDPERDPPARSPTTPAPARSSASA